MNAKKLLIFLQEGNVVRIDNETEYVKFTRFLTNLGFEDILLRGKDSYDDTIRLFNLPYNKEEGWDGKTLYAECQIGKESIGFYPYTSKVYDWYGVEPMSVDDVI